MKVLYPFTSVLVPVFTLLFFSVQAQTRVVGYIPNTLNVVLDYSRITHLNLAFENPDAAGNLSFSAGSAWYIREAHAHGIKVLVSIGGGAASEDDGMKRRYFRLIGEAGRARFVDKLCAYLIAHDLDGLDVDLEGSAINDDYGKFIRALADTLHPMGKLLTAALSHENGGDRVPDAVLPLFDFVNVMAYDHTGPWKPDRPGQHASLELAVASLDYWVQRGLPPSKAVLGVPFYGYGFGQDFNHGISYAQIVSTYAGAELHDVSGDTIYYNGLATMRRKAMYVAEGGYGGIMIWQLAQDAPGGKSLLAVIDEVLHKKK